MDDNKPPPIHTLSDAKVLKTRLLTRDVAARVVRSELVVEGSELARQMKSQVSEVKVVLEIFGGQKVVK